jgi:hypothetical protein
MKTIAEIKNEIIVNVSVWAEMPVGEQYVDITDVPNAGIGWGYVNGQFVEPLPVEIIQPISTGTQTL